MYNQTTILLYVSEAATLLRTSSQTVYKLIANDELKAFKRGRAWKISTQSVNYYANTQCNKQTHIGRQDTHV